MKIFNALRKKYSHAWDNEICPFCSEKTIQAQEVKSLEGNYWRVLVNKYPLLDGNILIIPKRHIIGLNDLDAEEWVELHHVIKRSTNSLAIYFNSNSYNIGANIDKYSGSSVNHLHIHLIPRVEMEKQTGFAAVTANLQTISISPDELKHSLDES